MKKVIVIEPSQGVFLGTFTKYAIFSKSDYLGLTMAYAFDDVEDAKKCMQSIMPDFYDSFMFCEIETTSKINAVSCVDIIKAGYGKYTYNMMDNLEMLSNEIH